MVWRLIILEGRVLFHSPKGFLYRILPRLLELDKVFKLLDIQQCLGDNLFKVIPIVFELIGE